MHVRNYSYMWNGSMDHRGRFWKPTTHSDEPRASPPPEGLNEGSLRSYLKSYDPDTDSADSVFLGESTYRIARLDEQGDTVMVIDVGAEPIPVTDEDRERYIASVAEGSPADLRVAEEVASLMPEFKPAIDQLILDDVGKLWVRRTEATGVAATYDVFRPDGEYAGTVTLDFDATRNLPIRIRDGRGYVLVTDSLDVPSVVRTERFPAFLRSGLESS